MRSLARQDCQQLLQRCAAFGAQAFAETSTRSPSEVEVDRAPPPPQVGGGSFFFCKASCWVVGKGTRHNHVNQTTRNPHGFHM